MKWRTTCCIIMYSALLSLSLSLRVSVGLSVIIDGRT